MRTINKSEKNWVQISLVILLFIFLYSKVFSWLAYRWYIDPDYSHGPLIPLISGYLVWIKRDRLKSVKVSTDIRGLYLLVTSLLLHVFSLRAAVYFTSAYSLIFAFAGIILYLYGREMMKELIFPICYLLFMVPFFQFLIDPISNQLKLFSAYLSAETLSALGISVYRDGVMMQFAKGSLEVANPCSGIRSIISLLALGTVFSYFSITSTLNKVLIVISAIPLAVIGNLVRILFSGIMMNAGIDSTTGFTHTLAGLIVFAVAFAGLIGVRKLLLWKNNETAV